MLDHREEEVLGADKRVVESGGDLACHFERLGEIGCEIDLVGGREG